MTTAPVAEANCKTQFKYNICGGLKEGLIFPALMVTKLKTESLTVEGEESCLRFHYSSFQEVESQEKCSIVLCEPRLQHC